MAQHDRADSRTATAQGRRGAATALPSTGDLVSGRFLIREELGRGGSGVVFRAVDLTLGRPVAVKVLRVASLTAEQRERLRREVTVSRSGHPNAVAIHELVEDGDWVALVMDLVEGESVRDRLQRRRRMPLAEVLEIGAQIAGAIGHLHATGIVHRDVKPANIMLRADGGALLCDMGLARPLAQGTTVTETRMVVGTPAYMAPEQATAEVLTAASDVYALGITLYHCLTGRVPLESSTALGTMMLRARSRPPRLTVDLPGAPRWLARLLRQMLEPDARDRPSAAEVERALRLRRQRWRPTRRWTVRAAAAAVAVAAVGVVAVAWTSMAGDPPVRMEVRAGGIVGLDDGAGTAWRHELRGEVWSQHRGDVDGDGRGDLAVVTRDAVDAVVREARAPATWIDVLRLDGSVITSTRLDDRIQDWDPRYPKETVPRVWFADADDDGRSEIVVACVQGNYFPTAVLLYWPAHDLWEQVLLHTGHVYAVAASPSDGTPGLRFLAVNNRLAMHPVVADLRLVPPDRRPSSSMPSVLGSPENGVGSCERASWGFYTLVPFHVEAASPVRDAPPGIEVDEDGSTTFRWNGVARRVDRFGNPVPGPCADRDLRDHRLGFLAAVARLGIGTMRRSGVLTVDVDAAIGDLETATGPLLEEPPYPTVLHERAARLLARSGSLPAAVRRLETAVASLRSDELEYRLANLEAVAGDPARAAVRARALAACGRTQRATFDTSVLLFRLAIELGDEDLLYDAARTLAASATEAGPNRELAHVLLARANLWWDRATAPSDVDHPAYRYEPDAEAVSCLLRWRSGRTRPGDPEAMRGFIARNPDSVHVGRAAWSAALLGLGRPGEALDVLEVAAAILEPDARDDLDARQTWDLMRALRATALAGVGDSGHARRVALRIRAEVRPHLLPAILAEEVLRSEE